MSRNNPLFNIQPFRLTLVAKLIAFICLLVLVMMTLLGFYTSSTYSNTLEEQIGIRALAIAQAISEIPEISNAFHTDNPSEIIQPIVEAIRVKTDSEFIVVGNLLGERYSHPNVERIGEMMVGDDNERSLVDGESYISKATGSLGPSIRGKVPITKDNGDIIGVVSVGFLLDDIEMTIRRYVSGIWYVVIAAMLIGIIGAILISLHVKKSILGLEPEKIGQLFQEREAIFQSIQEGLIAVDQHGSVTMANNQARAIFNEDTENLTGRKITSLLGSHFPIEVITTEQSQDHQDIWIKEERYIVHTVPLLFKQTLIGAVYILRNRTEVEELSEKLSNIQAYSEALRVQTHEFSNKLNTISGLLQLDQTEAAIEYITKEHKQQQKWIHFFIDHVTDPYVSAILIGKLNRAHELGITLAIDPNSQLSSTLSPKIREGFITIIGNILENAYDAVKQSASAKQEVRLFFTDIGSDIVFEVEDSGSGIPDEHTDKIFTKGFTTKDRSHQGIGLALVQQTLKDINGHLSLETSELGGACFIIAVPKPDLKNTTLEEEST